MPGRYVTFSFDLNMTAMTHLKEKSTYNHNYFELDLSVYGDYIIPEKCNILFEHAEDDSPFTYYSLGYFEEEFKGEYVEEYWNRRQRNEKV